MKIINPITGYKWNNVFIYRINYLTSDLLRLELSLLLRKGYLIGSSRLRQPSFMYSIFEPIIRIPDYEFNIK